jgi:hypothetical protein
LCKDGAKLHPDQQVREYTLQHYAVFWDRKEMRRLQRDPETGRMPEACEAYRF